MAVDQPDSTSPIALDPLSQPVTPPMRPSVLTSDLSPTSPRPPTRPSSPRSILAIPGSPRPSSRADRRLRFAEVGPQNVHVYQSAPSSPKRKALALPPPSAGDEDTVSLGQFKGTLDGTPITSTPLSQSMSIDSSEPSAEEGTPEDIRRRFFPDVPTLNPSLEWMSSSTSDQRDSSSLRLDLAGRPIPKDLSSTLPTHLGLHHHAEGEHAGYTLDDVFLLSRSTVPAQRAAMMAVMRGLARRLQPRNRDEEEFEELRGREDELRVRILAAGVAAMGERGSLGALAIEVIWICLVEWDQDLEHIEGVELRDPRPSQSSTVPVDSTSEPSETPKDVILSLPLDYVLEQISNAFGTAALPPESLSQLLAIIRRLTQHTNDIANTIVTTPKLIANLLRTFLLTPIPPRDDELLPDPAALDVLRLLVSASRENAQKLVEPTDALMRFIASVPSTSPFPSPLATQLLTGTLRLYAALAEYGLYASVATTAYAQLSQISSHVESLPLNSEDAVGLAVAWVALLERWMVCATDPHQTSPPHEILWTQVVGWGWGEHMMELSARLEDSRGYRRLWAAVWNAQSAWLEGSAVNGVRSGERERVDAVAKLEPGFRDGVPSKVVQGALSALSTALDKVPPNQGAQQVELDEAADILSAVIRLWLSCLPPRTESPPHSPPFALPFIEISHACAKLSTHPMWSLALDSSPLPWLYVTLRPLSSLLAAYLRLSRCLPDTSPDLWLAQTIAVLSRFLPGDEAVSRWALHGMLTLVTADFVQRGGLPSYPPIWEKGGMGILAPFLEDAIGRSDGSVVAPIHPHPSSLRSATSQRLSALVSRTTGPTRTHGLPLLRQWLLTPVDHLLKSGNSAVLASMPPSWDASETEVVRATLLFTVVSQSVLGQHGLSLFQLTREEVVLSCMKVFMLEHDQPHNDSGEEVFRDPIVGQLMNHLLSAYTLGTSNPFHPPLSPERLQNAPLETAALPFLGPGTPFFQFYTDFVALYDAVSFAHPTFAQLLLPPLSMRYPLDYRKHLWCDFAHVLRTVRTDVAHAITSDVTEYLWPVERDAQVLGAYLGALVKNTVAEGLLRFIAIHHVACNIWPDLAEENVEQVLDERGRKLLLALVEQGGVKAIREVVTYRQRTDGPAVLPSACFEDPSQEWRAQRIQFVTTLGDGRVHERLEGLLNPSATSG